MNFWNGKAKPKHEASEYFDEDDDLYVIQKKIDSILKERDREIQLLKSQVHNNTMFLQAIIMELIHKGTTTPLRSSSVPLNSGTNPNTKSVKELTKEERLAGPVGQLP